MKYAEVDAERIFQAVMIGIAFIIGAIVTIAITGPTILDSDSASYIIVTLLMSILFIFFTLKDRKPLKRGEYGTAIAAIVFVAYLIIVSYARGSLSSEFLTYRIDALLLPLLLLSIVLAIGGVSEIKRYAPVMVYLLFASPILLLPIINSPALATFSSGIVSGILRAGGFSVIQTGQRIVAPSGEAISISSTCVPVGTFLALIMLLIPVAYLYKGSLPRKLGWIVAGVLLLFVLNIGRMALIALAWMYSGVGGAVSTFHMLGGSIIFYLTLIVMLLIYGKFGLKLEWGKKWRKRLAMAFDAFELEENYGRIITAGLIAVAVLWLSLGYLGAPNVPVTSFTRTSISNSTYTHLLGGVISRIESSGQQYSYLGGYPGGAMMFELGKNASQPPAYMLVTFYPYPERGRNVLFSIESSIPRGYIMKSTTVTSFSAISNNTLFYVSYFAAPMTIRNGSAVTANFEVFVNASREGIQYCDPAESSGVAAYLESGIYNLIATGNPQHPPVLCAAEKLALVKIAS